MELIFTRSISIQLTFYSEPKLTKIIIHTNSIYANKILTNISCNSVSLNNMYF